MNVSVSDRLGESIGREMDTAAADVRHMTTAQLRRLGVHSVVYLRSGMMNGQIAYAIHGADGSRMTVVEDIDLAVELVTDLGMAFVAVH
jgi:hypothetical protein